MIEVCNLRKRYGDKLAVDDLSFVVEPGKVTGFLGPNGAGKSTTMRLLLGVALGTLLRHTAVALTVMIGILVVISNIARTLPGTVGAHVAGYLPTNAGVLITHAHQETGDLLTPWQGFAVFCGWALLLLGAGAYVLRRRDV